MTRSMTGFGKASREFDGQVISVELSSVNHRYFDCTLRTPNGWTAVEPAIKKRMQGRVARGKVTAIVNRKRLHAQEGSVRLDEDMARQYLAAAEQLKTVMGSNEPISLAFMAGLEGVFTEDEAEEDLAAIEEAVVQVLDEALDKLDAMRVKEGKVLADDVLQRVGLIRDELATIEERLPELSELYVTRLRERIADLGAEASITEERVAIEVAIMAEKGDVTEETVRLKTHLDHVGETLDRKEPVGRRLDFLAQEIQREVNTLGVKTRDADVAKHVLTMKSEVEKIREQVQNIE